LRFALLGADADALLVARVIARRREHEIVWHDSHGDARHQVAEFAPLATVGDHWESLLAGDVADAAIVGRAANEEVRADQLRKLIQARVPLIVCHPAHSSMLVCYELEMIRQTTGCPILPYHAAIFSPAVEQLRRLIGNSSGLGELQQVIMDRWLANRSATNVREAFARDADVARFLAGDLTRLAAMAPSSEPSGYANLGIQLSGPSGALVRWSVGPGEHAPGGRMTLIGSLGRAVLQMPDESPSWRLELIWPDRSTVDEVAAADCAARAADAFERLIAGEPAVPSWSDACRAVELADSIQRSLEKGRTVELHQEDYTEESTFKGTMTSLGCGLLWISFLVLVGGVIAAGFRAPLSDYWPAALLAALVLFLILQLLRFAFPPRPKKT
jgi:myo-inositol 2-dehydrogenase/D-chiro-inositol 1-dehydrogenase